jgi:diacylglycerol kinase family enzyme
VFLGRIGQLPGVTILRGEQVEITSAQPMIFHIDGEPFVGGTTLRARIHPQALRIRVPKN